MAGRTRATAKSPALYEIHDTEGGYAIEHCTTWREAMATLNRFEREDRRMGSFTPGTYTIARFNGEYYEPIYNSLLGEIGDRPRRKTTKKTTRRR